MRGGRREAPFFASLSMAAAVRATEDVESAFKLNFGPAMRNVGRALLFTGSAIAALRASADFTSSAQREHEMTEKRNFSTYIRRAAMEMGFIIFLFYSNLLMGQYNRGHDFSNRPLSIAFREIITLDNLIIAVITAFLGHFVFDYMRKRI